MALTAYLTQFNELIQAPNSPIPLISTVNATAYINTARNQVASEGECIRVLGTLPLTAGITVYGFSSISLSNVSGAQNVLSVRKIVVGASRVAMRPWSWFFNYYYGSLAVGQTTVVSQEKQGEQGTLWVYPVPPVSPLPLTLDVIATPIPLVDDTTIEAIPYPWTDAVPFYAAWLGMQNMQRQGDADKMLARYTALMRRARQMSTPSVLPDNLPGGAGTKKAAAHTSLTDVPQQQAGR